MLKSELIRPRLKTKSETVAPKRLPIDYRWLDVASDLITLFQQHSGRSRATLHAALRDYEGDSIDYPIIRGLAAVLEGRCTFASDPPLDPATLRERLFTAGPTPIEREKLIGETAVFYDLPPAQIEASLFADLAEEQIMLNSGDPISPADLIRRYNLEVARGLLYWAMELRLTLHDSYKDVFKFIKLFKLMHTVTPDEADGYRVVLHGPISPFVTSTQRYGLQFAKFMPALLLCQRWQMEADVRPPSTKRSNKRPLRYTLDDSTDLATHFKASGEFDSKLEANFAAEFEEKYERGKRKWELSREDELILLEDTVMIPDFALTHKKDGRRALIEIVGFWHPDYLRRKLEKVTAAQRSDLILLVYESAAVADMPTSFSDIAAGEVLFFKKKPVLKDVLAAAERCAR